MPSPILSCRNRFVWFPRKALGPSRLLSLLTTWRTRMRSTISSQSELCLSRLVFSPRVIVLMFISVYLGWARCLRAMTRKAARKPRSSHPCFAHFFWFQDAVFCVVNRPSLPLYCFLVGWTLFLFYSLWNLEPCVFCFAFFLFFNHIHFTQYVQFTHSFISHARTRVVTFVAWTAAPRVCPAGPKHRAG